MLKTLVRISQIFKREDLAKFAFLFFGTLLNSLLEIMGIGLILPFIALLGQPELLTTNAFLNKAYHFFSFQSFNQFMIVISAAIILVFFLKNVLILFLSFWQTRFAVQKQAYLSARLFRAYLMSPYVFHLRRPFAQLQRNLGLVTSVMQSVVLQLFNILTEAVLVACLFVVLLMSRPFLTLVVMVILSGGLYVYFHFIKGKMYQWGRASNYHTMLLTQHMNQGLGSIKEAKLLGKEEFFADRYRYHWEEAARQMIKSDIVTKSPRLFIEMIVVGLVMLSMILCLMAGETPGKIFATISLFAVVAIRLMPSLNRISAAASTVRFYISSFEEIYSDLVSCEGEQCAREDSNVGIPVVFNNSIELKNVVFSYENANVPALEGVSLAIPKNSTIGFAGASGAGKTTVVDIILGLLEPSSGKVLVDGVDIHGNLRSWQRRVGYIPQVIYLCDDSIKNNVAFGLETHEINEEKVWQALRLAQLEEFVRSLPQGVETKIGERGARLSGGQRQRIGIARALYNDPEVLVMDEATAALDNDTEREFMEALAALTGKKTILIIAHRLSTVRRCDIIFFMQAGRVIDSGKFDDLLSQSPEFCQMAGGVLTTGYKKESSN